MGSRSRRKGHAFEREVSKLLEDVTGVECKRQLTETRKGNIGDIETALPLSVQCKVGQRPRIYAALAEAEEAADGTGQHPVAVVRRNGTNKHDPPVDMAIMPLEDWLELVGLLKAHGVW